MTLKRGDLAHLLASSLYEHVGLLRDPASKGKLRVSRDAVAKLQAGKFEAQNAEIRRDNGGSLASSECPSSLRRRAIGDVERIIAMLETYAKGGTHDDIDTNNENSCYRNHQSRY